MNTETRRHDRATPPSLLDPFMSLHLLPVSSFSSSQRSKLAGVWLLDNCSVKLYHRVENFVKDAADRVAALLKSFLCHAVGRVLADDFEKYRKRLFHRHTPRRLEVTSRDRRTSLEEREIWQEACKRHREYVDDFGG